MAVLVQADGLAEPGSDNRGGSDAEEVEDSMVPGPGLPPRGRQLVNDVVEDLELLPRAG